MKYFIFTFLAISIFFLFFIFNIKDANKNINKRTNQINYVVPDNNENLNIENKNIKISVNIDEKYKKDLDFSKIEHFEFENKVLPSEIHHDVPFTSQAPFRDWGMPYQEACEEAAVLITMRYFDNSGFKDKYDAREALLKIIDWEKQNFGFYKDSSATTTAKIIADFYNYKNVKVSYKITIEKIKKELAEGNLIIIPVAGRNLENPYFTPPGPIYHNLVIVGYNDKKEIFYTNDPGIMSGKDFKYSYENIIKSIADWSYEKKTIDKNRKVMIIVKKNDF
ncbi:MAG: C39 family peptidase [Patescibacteria group bacterium]|nr:C39 family peptidase [Patescibacteria group bacterium]